ncbi:hypothetical protein KY362_05315 [Candidatus Woesearchaeota archaeon]|nr:hypothetical protein [Candidatus Woesearchaeota archaeon]
MTLYPLLKDRASINILKILYDNEVVDKTYCMSEWDLDERLPMRMNRRTLALLRQSGLVSAEQTQDNGTVLSITQKGKDFVTQFDKLIEIMRDEKAEVKAYKVEYDLTEEEQKMLTICFQLHNRGEKYIERHTLAAEMYPMMDITGKIDEIMETAARLQKLNLLDDYTDVDGHYFLITEVGERVVKEQMSD